jgi:ribonuclease P protein component
MKWVTDHDADVQTPEPEEKEQAWLPSPDGDQRRKKDSEPAKETRPAAFGGARRLEVEPVSWERPKRESGDSFRFPPSVRISRADDIRTLLRRGGRKKTSHLDVFFLSSGVPNPRIGFVVPKHHRSAVDRNRVKRRLREIGRLEVLPRLRNENLSLDLLVRARREAYEASFRQLREELLEVTEELCSGPYSWR